MSANAVDCRSLIVVFIWVFYAHQPTKSVHVSALGYLGCGCHRTCCTQPPCSRSCPSPKSSRCPSAALVPHLCDARSLTCRSHWSRSFMMLFVPMPSAVAWTTAQSSASAKLKALVASVFDQALMKCRPSRSLLMSIAWSRDSLPSPCLSVNTSRVSSSS